MKLRLSGWKSEGLRCPDVPVELELKDTKGAGTVHLIQMPNGTGKTTTLQLLRACLTGSAARWLPDQILEFRPQGAEGGKGYFEVRLEFDKAPLFFRLAFDFDDPSVEYQTTSPAIGGLVHEWRPPSALRRFLYTDFVNLLIFDGEFAADLMTPGKTRADDALNAMCQLHLFEEIRTFAASERDLQVRAAGKGRLATKGNSLKRNQDDLEKVRKLIRTLETRRDELRGQQAELATQISAKQYDLERLFDRVTAEDSDVSIARRRVADAEADQAAALAALWKSLHNPYSVTRGVTASIVEFRKHLDTVKLPDATSRQFFIELADEAMCVCGRPIGEAERHCILMHSDHFLGDQEAGVLNALKLDVDQAAPVANQPEEVRYAAPLAKVLGDSLEALDAARSELTIVEQRHVGTERDRYQRLKEELDALRGSESKISEALGELTRPARRVEEETSICIEYQRKRQRDLEKEVETLTDTVDIGERTRILEGILDKARDMTRELIREQLIRSGNERLGTILRNSPLRISDVVPHIKLQGQTGASVGQKLAVGYVFLGGLLHRGAHSLPLVVDSPASGIDLTVGREVGRMIPKLCDQFVTFVISRERPGFVDELERSASAVQYITIFRRLPGTARFLEQAKGAAPLTTERSVLVEDKAFFMSFDTERTQDE